jgi:hypothetical protein
MVGDAAGRNAGTKEVEGPLTIINHGTLRGDALEAVFRDSMLAVSSLTMFRIGLREGCVLKTREYAARGLPFVYGYDDVDLTRDLPFCMYVGSTESPIAIEELIRFASGLREMAGVSEDMRAWAESHVDWRVKMRTYYDFAREVAESSPS